MRCSPTEGRTYFEKERIERATGQSSRLYSTPPVARRRQERWELPSSLRRTDVRARLVAVYLHILHPYRGSNTVHPEFSSIPRSSIRPASNRLDKRYSRSLCQDTFVSHCLAHVLVFLASTVRVPSCLILVPRSNISVQLHCLFTLS